MFPVISFKSRVVSHMEMARHSPLIHGTVISWGQTKPVAPGLCWHLRGGKHNSKLRKLRAGALWPAGFWRFETVAAICPPNDRTQRSLWFVWGGCSPKQRLFLFLGLFFSSLHCLSYSCCSWNPIIAKKMHIKSVSTAKITRRFLA